jgi:peptide/nickel transport system permease protein
MISFLTRRLFQGVLVLIAVILGTFVLEHFVPGGPAVVALGRRATPHNIYLYNVEHGLNKPIIIQVWHYLGQVIFHFDLGYSLVQNAPVTYLLGSALGHTVVLVAVSIVLQFLLAIPLGILQAQRRNGAFDYVATTITFILYATPVFLIGEFLISFFAIRWHFFPVTVSQNAGSFSIFTSPRQFVLPVFTLTFLGLAGLSRFQRSSMLDTLTQDYIRTARAKGLPNRMVIRRHALRNSFLPIVTIIGLSLPGIVGGALITETLFDIPGMGLLTLRSAQNQDMPVVVGATILAAGLTIIGSIVADVLYAVADPRIRLSSGRK